MFSMDKVVRQVARTITEYSPAILTALGVAGVLTTAVFTAKATATATLLIDMDERETGVSDIASVRFKERTKLVWKLYIPPAGMALASIACIIGVNAVHTRRNAALASAYTLAETAMKEYQAQVAKHIGEREERKVRDAVSEEKIRSNPIGKNEVFITGTGDMLFYDTLSGRYFTSTVEKVNRAENSINAKIIAHMYASANDFYDEIGLAQTEYGDDVGWRVGHMIETYVTAKVTEEDPPRPCLVLNHRNRPVPQYYKVF